MVPAGLDTEVCASFDLPSRQFGLARVGRRISRGSLKRTRKSELAADGLVGPAGGDGRMDGRGFL